MSGREADAATAGFARYFVTDRRRFNLSIDALIERIVVAARRGVDVIQLRERDLSDRDLVSLVHRVCAATAATPARILVNDRADIAIAAGARGVHLRADSAPASRVRAISPAGFIVGRSVHSIAAVDAAIQDGGCDYLLLGTLFPSTGKAAGHPVAGLDVLRTACERSPIPIVAIGGINEERASDAMRAGAAGVAAVEWFMRLTPLPEVV